MSLTPFTPSITPAAPHDAPAIERLVARAFGPGRFTRTAYRLRERADPDPALSFVAHVGTLLVGSIVLTPVRCGAAPALLLGPLTVEPAFQSVGIGEALVARALAAAREAGHALVVLVGDQSYYGRMGFAPAPRGRLTLPGPVDEARILFYALTPNAFEGVSGRITAG